MCRWPVGGDDHNITVRKNTGGRGDFVAWMVLPYGDAIKLAKAKVVMDTVQDQAAGKEPVNLLPLPTKSPCCRRMSK